MKPLLVREYLLTHTLFDLEHQHGVKSRINGRKFSLNYNMIEAKDDDELASQCRGLILYRLDEGEITENTVIGNTEILCRPMDRFFNHGQSAATNIDFDSSRIFEKLDGTMVALHFDRFKDQWCIATRSVSEADLPIDGYDHHTFRSLFEKALEETTRRYFSDWAYEQLIPEDESPNNADGFSFDEWTKRELLNKSKTYIFELCTPENQIVVKYDDYRVFLLAIRNNESGIEEEINNRLIYLPVCPSYKLSSFDDMMKFVSNREASQHEGVVLRDRNFNRVKIKNANYLALNKIRDNALKSPRSLLQLALAEKLDDAIPLLPEHAKKLAEKMKYQLACVWSEMQDSFEHIFAEVEHTDDQKELRKRFALCVKKHNANMEYVMLRLMGKIAGFHDFAERNKEISGDYKTTFLDMILEQMEKCE